MNKKDEFRAKNAARALNAIREISREFEYQNFMQMLKIQKCPYHQRIFTLLKNEGLIEKTMDGTYKFSSESPIFYKVLESGLAKIARSYQESHTKYKNKFSSPQPQQNIEDDTEKMIIHLKSLGYKILKPEFREV